MQYLTCGLALESDKSLEEVGHLIAERLVGGIPFGGKERYIYDEVPAIYAQHDVLGLRIILQGFGGEDGYYLEFRPMDFPSGAQVERVDISDYIAFLLSDIPGVQIIGPE